MSFNGLIADFFYFFLTLLSGYNSLANFVVSFFMYNKMNQLYVAIFTLHLPHPIPLDPHQSPKLSSLCYTAGSH